MAIAECYESLVPIPVDLFILPQPPAYQSLGADYGGKSPYYLRQGVLEALIRAQNYLQELHPGWRFLVFDAYRPVSVQQFMVDYTFMQVLAERTLNPATLTREEREVILAEVYQFWAVPSLDAATPPPHSTGAAVDLTLVNEGGEKVPMGGKIDDFHPRTHPDYYLNSPEPNAPTYHYHRQLLHQVMREAGFRRHPAEWWHFSRGDQLWAWLSKQENPKIELQATYGRM
jgi:D-alanyl-D-alanine dipeptidase